MIAALAILGLLQTQVDQPPRLRTILPNGAIVLIERMPKADSISVQLFASSRSVRETPETNGYRHLLEHLIATGKNGDIDRRLETKGMYLRAWTMRDAMRFEVTGAPDQLADAINAIGEVLAASDFSKEQIARELPILESELALKDDAAKLGTGAWTQAYGDQGLDPSGNLDTIKRATPETMLALHRKQFYPENLVMVVAGPVDLDDATKRMAALIGQRQGAIREPATIRQGKAGRIEVSAFGEARGAIVPSFQDPATMCVLALSLAVATEFESSFVAYTPSVQNGLVVVGQASATSGLGLRLDALEDGSLGRLFGLGKVMARGWIDRQLATPSGVGYLRGLLLVQGISYRPEMMLENVDAMTFEQFKDAAKTLRKETAVVAVGRP